MPKKTKKSYHANHKHWQTKADNLFMRTYLGLPCEVCGANKSSHGGREYRSAAHHIIHKKQNRHWRYSKKNIIVLCPEHHLWSHEMSAHYDKNLFAIQALANFVEWEKSEQYHWCKSHQEVRDRDGEKWTYRDAYICLYKLLYGGWPKDVSDKNIERAVEWMSFFQNGE